MNTLDATFGAFADSTRRSLVSRLATGPATVNELAQPFRISQQAISKHLAFLQRAGLIRKRKVGRQQVCTLQADRFREAAEWMEDYRRIWEERLDRFDDYLSEIKKKENKHDS